MSAYEVITQVAAMQELIGWPPALDQLGPRRRGLHALSFSIRDRRARKSQIGRGGGVLSWVMLTSDLSVCQYYLRSGADWNHAWLLRRGPAFTDCVTITRNYHRRSKQWGESNAKLLTETSRQSSDFEWDDITNIRPEVSLYLQISPALSFSDDVSA